MAAGKFANKYIGQIMTGLLVLTAILFFFPQMALADMGPKPEITVIVKNPPPGEYYLDLLVKEGSYDNLNGERTAYDQEKLSILEEYNQNGWHPGLTTGTVVPMFGKLTGDKNGDVTVHQFSYVGVPEDFKIIIVAPDNQLIVSEEVHRNTYQATLSYDYATGAISQRPLSLAFLEQFLVTCTATLIIEGLVLLLFSFSLKKNWRAFLGLNLATQVFLTITIGTAVFRQGAFTASLLYVPAEILIVIAEAIAYSILLKQHGKTRRIFYALTANILSFAAGLVLIWL